ncbi:MAG: helix-turn-helix domain-containing protein, partial [Pseudolabrys sp.]
TAEAVTDANILFFKRSALFSMAKRESQIADFLLTTTLAEIRRTQEHTLLISRAAKSRVASFLIDLSKRIRTQNLLDLPMSHQDIADHLGLTIETISRMITQMERSGLITRGRSYCDLILNNRQALARMAD